MPGEKTVAKMKATRQTNGTNIKESERMKARWADPQIRAKTIAKMRSVPPRTPEQRKRYSEARKSQKISEETKRKLSKIMKARVGELSARGKRVLQINPADGSIVETFPTARAAAASIDAGLNVISATCRKDQRRKQFSHGYYWCYEEDYDEFLKTIELNPKIKQNGKLAMKPVECWMFGKHLTERQKEAISAAKGKAVMCVETGVVYKSLKEAAGHYGSSRSGSAIMKQIRGSYNQAFGHTWKYINEV